MNIGKLHALRNLLDDVKPFDAFQCHFHRFALSKLDFLSISLGGGSLLCNLDRSMIRGHGIDIEEISSIGRAYEKNERFAEKNL